MSRLARIRTRTREVGARDASVTPQACVRPRPGDDDRSGVPACTGRGSRPRPPGEITDPRRPAAGRASGRPGSNRPLRSGAPALFRLSYIRVEHARLGSNQRPLASQTSALSAELRAFDAESLRQDSNPHLGRTKGACLPLTLRRPATPAPLGTPARSHRTKPIVRGSTCSNRDSPAKRVATQFEARREPPSAMTCGWRTHGLTWTRLSPRPEARSRKGQVPLAVPRNQAIDGATSSRSA